MAERAARARPDAPGVQLAWASALEGAGLQDAALERLEWACGLFPADEALHSAFAAALTRAGRVEAGLAQVARWNGADWARRLEFRLLMRAARFERLEGLDVALARTHPTDPDLLEYRALKLRDRPEALLQTCDDMLATDPGAVHIVYHKALALVALGRSEEAAALMGLDHFLWIGRLDPPAPPQFNAALQREIESNPTLHSDPVGHATKAGRRTATFPLPGDCAGRALVRAIKEKIADYAAGLSGEDPFVQARPARATFKSWALVFDSKGHQLLHRHPGPWLTGVYYVTAPGGDRHAGALRIGAVPPWLGRPPPWQVIDVQPVPGTLVLFPSFVPHETLPTGSDQVRISVAFDVAAAEG